MTNKVKVAILQSNYLPWKGVFDLINRVDKFVFLDDVQYTVRDWRNRNKIMTQNGTKWISVPVKNVKRREQLICEAEIDNDTDWCKKHFNSFQMNYAKAPFFKKYKYILEDIYFEHKWNTISELNIYSTKLISKALGIDVQFYNSCDLNTTGKKDDKLIQICQRVGGNYYLSGPAAKDYIVNEKFQSNNIELDYIEYEYPEYKQGYSEFNHYVTVLDLLFNCGEDAPYYIWGWREDKL